MELVIQAAAAAVAGAICAVVVRRHSPELALVLGLVTAVLLLSWGAAALSQAMAFLDELAQLAGLSEEVLEPLLKTVAIAILTRMTVQLCEDAGEKGIGSAVEFCGGAAALFVSVPLLRTVLQALEGLL